MSGLSPSEHAIQSALFEWWDIYSMRHGLTRELMFAIPNGGRRDAVTGARLKAEGVRPGVPDIFLACPCGPYHGLFLELKTDVGRPTKNQKQMLKLFDSHGYATVVAHGFDQAVDYIKHYIEIN